MDDLPPEVLQHFFMFTTPYKIGNLALVCKNWRMIANEEPLWKDMFARYFGGSKTAETWQQSCKDAVHEMQSAAKKASAQLTANDCLKAIIDPSALCGRTEVALVVVGLLARRGHSIALQRILTCTALRSNKLLFHRAFAFSSAGGHIAQMEWLLSVEKEVDVNFVHYIDTNYTTALFLAVQNDRLDSVKYLLQQGAKDSVLQRELQVGQRRARFINTPSACAAAIHKGKDDITRLFVQAAEEKQAPLERKTKELHAYVEEAVKAGDKKILAMMLEETKLCNINYVSGLSAADGICVSLNKPADPATTKPTLPRLTPIGPVLFYAAMSGNVDIARHLISLGADVNQTTTHNRTALHVACYYGHESVVELLLESGADIAAATTEQATPFSIALWRDQGNIQARLEQELVKRKGKG